MSEVRAAGLAGLMLTVWVGLAAAEQSVYPTPLLAAGQQGPNIAALEARVSVQPSDTAALVELGDHYLALGSPGLARAALDRAPRRTLSTPKVADLQARTWVGLGEFHLALDAQNQLLQECAEGQGSPCSRRMVGMGRARQQKLRARLGEAQSPIRIARLDLD